MRRGYLYQGMILVLDVRKDILLSFYISNLSIQTMRGRKAALDYSRLIVQLSLAQLRVRTLIHREGVREPVSDPISVSHSRCESGLTH